MIVRNIDSHTLWQPCFTFSLVPPCIVYIDVAGRSKLQVQLPLWASNWCIFFILFFEDIVHCATIVFLYHMVEFLEDFDRVMICVIA